jgi:hypothetical protein
MNRNELIEKLCEIDHGKYEDIVHVMDINDNCAQCGYFNLGLPDIISFQPCRSIPRCIAVTLSNEVVRKMNHLLGWTMVSEWRKYPDYIRYPNRTANPFDGQQTKE